MTDTTTDQRPEATIAEVTADVRDLAGRMGRPDLESRAAIALGRLRRPSTVVAVVGEFKQGKSSLINALLGRIVCPVDDDLATSAITVVHHADEPTAVVRRRQDGQPVAETVDATSLRDYVTEAGNPDNEQGVERLEVGVPHPLLVDGLTLVDSPGMGSVGPGAAAATLSFLPYADALLFVSDASAELSAPEVEFLRVAIERCPAVVFCLTKIDLYPEWRRIAALNHGHLERAGIPATIFPLSASLRQAAVERGAADLEAESGFGPLLEFLDERVIRRARQLAARRAVMDSRVVLDQLSGALESEQAVLVDPDRAAAAQAGLEEARAKLEHLKGPGSRWGMLLNDRMTDLSNDASHGFRGAIRAISKSFDERIEALETAEDWEALAAQLQEEVARAVAAVFDRLATGAEDARSEVAGLLARDAADLPPLAAGRSTDLSSLWTQRGLRSEGLGERVMAGVSVLRGAQGGLIMLGMMGRLLPAAASSVLLSNPITLGIGIVFVGQQLVAQRKRKVTALRQQAKQSVRQFLDEVQFEMGNELTETMRTIQRQLRDEFGDLVNELARTYTGAARQAQEAVQSSQAQRKRRLTEIEAQLQELGALAARVDAAGGAA